MKLRSRPIASTLRACGLRALLAGVFCAPLAAHAQAAAPARTDTVRAPAAAATFTDTVRVSRDRLPGRGLSTPAAVTEIKASELVNGRQVGLDDALESVPGAIAQSRSGGQDVRITIRGFGARGAGERSNAGTTRGIRIQLDGFPLTEPDGRTSLDLADMGSVERVRVVRSNSSALFGSASGGLIDLTTHSRIGSRSYELRSSFGSFGLQRHHAVGTLPFGNADGRVSISGTSFDGWRQHSKSRTATLQASVLSALSRRAELGVFFAGTNNDNEQPGALTPDEFAADPRQADPAYVERNYRRENQLGRVGVRLQQGLRSDDQLSLSAFVEPKALHRAERNRFRDFTRYHTGGSASYRWQIPAAPDLKLSWTNGVDDAYQDGTVLFYDLGPNGSRGTNLMANTREAINTFGVFSQLESRPSPKLDLSAGVRYDLVTFIFEDFITPELGDQRTMNRLSPRAAVSYRVRPGQSVFVAFASGIEAPAYNEVEPPPPFDTVAGLNPFLKPAHSFTLEAGTKGTQLLRDDGKAYLRYDAAVYGLEVYNDIIPYDAGAYYLTAGKSRRYGLETGAELRLANGVYSRLAFTVSHNRYVEYTNELGTFDGNESAGIAPLVFDVKAGWEAAFGGYVEAGVHALGSYYANDANTHRVPAYGSADLTVGARRRVGPGQFEAFVACDNLLDEHYVGSTFINAVGDRFIEPGMERNVLFGLRYSGK